MPARSHRAVGQTTRLPLQQFIRRLLEQNEARSQSGQLPLTDEQLEQCVRDEFKHAPQVMATLDTTDRNIIAVWRNRYNHGRLASGTPGRVSFRPPTVISFSYGPDGLPINPKSRVPLTEAEIQAIVSRLDIADPRFRKQRSARQPSLSAPRKK